MGTDTAKISYRLADGKLVVTEVARHQLGEDLRKKLRRKGCSDYVVLTDENTTKLGGEL